MSNENHDHDGKVRCQACIDDAVAAAIHRTNMLHERWKREITAKAHDWADEAGLCETYDNFMESIGLERRSRDFLITVRVEMEFDVEIEATSPADAQELLDTNDVADALKDEGVEYRIVRIVRN